MAGGGRFEYQHAARLGIRAPAGEVGERRMGAEGIVGIVRPLLQAASGDDQALAAIERRHTFTTAGGER
jgi:hypothetical protein